MTAPRSKRMRTSLLITVSGRRGCRCKPMGNPRRWRWRSRSSRTTWRLSGSPMWTSLAIPCSEQMDTVPNDMQSQCLLDFEDTQGYQEKGKPMVRPSFRWDQRELRVMSKSAVSPKRCWIGFSKMWWIRTNDSSLGVRGCSETEET